MPDISGSRVLVTGGSGLIGSHTVDRLIKEPVEKIVIFDKYINEDNLAVARKSDKVEIITGDLNNPNEIGSALEGIDFVFHFAAMLFFQSSKNPRVCLSNNINGTFNLIELFLQKKVKRLIYASSVSIYGSSNEQALMDENYPFMNRSMYGASKIVAEQFCRVFHELAGLNYISLRYSSVYGPRQHYEGVYPRLIMHALDRIENGLPPQIQGDGSEVQDLIAVDDISEANILALKSDISDEAFNIASGVATTVNELIQCILNLTDSNLNVEYIPAAKKSLVAYRRFSIDKAKNLLSFTPKISLIEGLKKLIEWKKTAK